MTSWPDQHPRLFFKAEARPKYIEFTHSLPGQRLLQRLDLLLTYPYDAISIGAHAAGYAFKAWLHDDVYAALMARQLIDQAIAGLSYNDSAPLWHSQEKMIFRIKAVLDAAIAYDLCGQFWNSAYREHLVKEFTERAIEFTTAHSGKGFNDKPWSNWMASTNAAGAFIALTILPDVANEETQHQLHAAINDGIRDLIAWLDQAIGDSGHCIEGFNYLRYPMTTSGFQLIHALKNDQNHHPLWEEEARQLLEHPHLLAMPAYYLTQLIHSPGEHPYFPFYGLSYRHADRPDKSGFDMLYERSKWRSNDLALMMAFCPDTYRELLEWTFDKLFGIEGDQTFETDLPGNVLVSFSQLAQRKSQQSFSQPTLPSPVLQDHRCGHYVMRRGLRNRADLITTIYANQCPKPGSYSFQDAGSFRIYGLGTRWADQQSRLDLRQNPTEQSNIHRSMENVVHLPHTNNWLGGRVIQSQFAENGSGQVSMDLSKVYAEGDPGSIRSAKPGPWKATRCMATSYDQPSGVLATWIIVDEIQGPGEKQWTLHSAAKVEAGDDLITLTNEEKAQLQIHIIHPEQAMIAIDPGKETQRIRIHGDSFFIVMCLCSPGATAPSLSIAGERLDSVVALGDLTISYRDQWIQIV